MAHRRGSFRRSGGISESQRRKKSWISIKTPTGATLAGDTSFVTSIKMTAPVAASSGLGNRTAVVFGVVSAGEVTGGDEFSNLPEESTILRARGSLLFPKTDIGLQTNAVDFNYSFGFGVTDIRSIVLGAVPTPITDSDWDGWMFLRQSALPPVEANSGIVDVKAMRKIKTGDAFFLAAEGVANIATAVPAADWVIDLRLLMLLP